MYSVSSATGNAKRKFDYLLDSVSIGRMIAMPQQFAGGTYLTVSEAADFMGCTEGWVRMLILRDKLKAVRVGRRTLLILQSSAVEARGELTTRSVGKRGEAKRPAALRKAPKRASNNRGKG